MAGVEGVVGVGGRVMLFESSSVGVLVGFFFLGGENGDWREV